MNKYDVDIVVIDSGCSLDCNNIKGGITITNDNIISDYTDNIGHGTAITNIIIEQNPQCSVFCVKIFESFSEGISQSLLLKALEYVCENISCKIINLSLGVLRIEKYTKWINLINKISNKNILIVSAFNNDGAVSYPAAFENVIGVDEIKTFSNSIGEYVFLKNNYVVNVVLNKKCYRTVDNTGKKIITNGTSSACAYITGFLCEHINTNENILFDAIKVLEDNASYISDQSFQNVDESFYKNELLLKAKNAVVFPFNKEIHAIANFEDLLSFNVLGYYDHNISMYKNKKINNILEYSTNESIIRSINELDWTGDFDIFICGHCREMEDKTNKAIISDIIKKCVEYKKILYSFDDISEELITVSDEDKKYFFYPYASKESLKNNQIGKLRQTSLPVLGVFGTSSVQGKYFLQLSIRREMLNRGISVGQISTEPSGYLFGMDYVYPMGYNSSVYVDGASSVMLLNEKIWEIEKKEPDILLIGCQSGTVPFALYNISNLVFQQNELVLGTCPDAIILCVNVYDTMDYIMRTVNYLESIIRAKVIGLVLSPLDLNSKMNFSNLYKKTINEELVQDFKNNIKSKTNLEVYRQNDISKIVDLVVNYFS